MTNEEKETIVQSILEAVATASPDKLKRLQAAVAPIEPPALKAEVVAIGTEVKSDAERVAEIKAALMALDDATLGELQSAILPKSGGYTPAELAAMLARREERKAELARRLAAAKEPLGQRLKRTTGDLLRGLLIVFAGAVSSAVGSARRRTTRRA